MLVAPGEQEHECDASANGAVRYIECRETNWPGCTLHVEVQEIDHVLDSNAVNQISEDAADDHAESDLAEQRAGVEMMPREVQDEQCGKRDDCEQAVVTGEHAPGGARVTPVDQFEETFDHDLLFCVAQVTEHKGLRELVESQHNQRDQRDAPVGCAEKRTGRIHIRPRCLTVSHAKNNFFRTKN